MIGQILNHRYKIISLLGEGGMGEVYLASDEKSHQQVAVKILARQLTANPEALERFKREGETLRQLDHPNIVKFVDAFEYEKQYVIVMEYVSGGNLQNLIKQGVLPIEQARQITLDLCDALIRAHRLNIIHRDIKPENVLITENGTPKLADFGVARLSESTSMTRSGTQVGTPYYMAPEAWEGKTLDAQADIWSLGVMLFEMLAGKVPFGGETGAAVMNKILTTQPPDLRKLRADVPTHLTKIIRRMLTRDKKGRYSTMREVAVELERGQQSIKTISKNIITSWVLKIIATVLVGLIIVVIIQEGRFALTLLTTNTVSSTEISNQTPTIAQSQETGSVPQTISNSDLLLYDDFNNSEYDGKYNITLWSVNGSSGVAEIYQQDGALVLSDIGNSGGEGFFINPKNWKETSFSFFQVKVKLSDQHEGNEGNISLTVDSSITHDIPGNWAELSIGHRTTSAGIHTQFGNGSGFESTNAQYNTWYTLRIEFDSNTNTFSYFIDNQLFSTNKLLTPDRNIQFKPVIQLWHRNGTSVMGYIDDVVIGLDK